jgi:SUMO ligase MMS21 Smc5/6 complex component
MDLSKLIEIKQNYEKTVEQRLLEMTTYFHQYMWDGSTENENDPKFLSREDFEGIEALVGKIKHMIFNIGCPLSIEPMLLSIISRKIKHWQANDNVETKDKTRYEFDKKLGRGKTIITSKGFKKGKQLKNNSDLRRVYSNSSYYRDEVQNRVISGHFRWNNRGYILSRVATDALLDYYETNF